MLAVGVGKPVFSFGELLVLIDVEGVGPMSAPLPTPAEAAALTGGVVRGAGAGVDARGPVRFRTGLAHLYEPPTTELVVSPGHVLLAITRFPDDDIWKNMSEWVDGYLTDTLAPTPASAAADGHHGYAGQGVIATVAFTRPRPRHDSRDLVIEVGLRHDDAPLAALRRLFGLAVDASVAPPDDGNWRELASGWPMHLECSRHGDTTRFRFSSPHHDPQISTASLCEEWCRAWLDLCAGTAAGTRDRSRSAWELGRLGHASMIRGTGAHRRDVHELHVPSSWLTA